ncbi:hypothetical protein BMS3Abin01_01101 [bacterium BMS3Abin01]|nr:hypothetical protein BMS3Abin01_01101 [bacterium BMS3Abin01]HDZ59679.1 DUF3842 family protein [Actinomycetota bacterium]
MSAPVIAVIDGMGGNIGHQIISQLRRELPDDVEIIAFGTNSAATANMMRARASRGATGENAIRVSIGQADVILAPAAAVIANSYLGELTPGMAEAIASADAEKILLPMGQRGISFVATSRMPLPHLMEEALARLRQLLGLEEEVNKDV